jgi:GMP synthase (glutamine-hydrolysing)
MGKPRRPVCIHVCGAPPAPVAAEHGVFADWFRRLLSAHPVDATATDATTLTAPPDPSRFAALILTGSPASVTEPEPWKEAAMELVREAARVGTPVLGVCFGHQIAAAALGGTVLVNPLGWEIGTREVELTGDGLADPLFAGLGPRLRVNFSHRDVVDPDSLPPAAGVRVLARNRKSAAQAFAAGDAVRCIQFHPEFDGAVTRGYLRARHDLIAADAAERGEPGEHPAVLLEGTGDTPDSERVFHNFIRHWALKA